MVCDPDKSKGAAPGGAAGRTSEASHSVPDLADGFCKSEEPARLLAFSVSLRNPADYDNGIARLELQLDYETNTGAAMMVKLADIGGDCFSICG